MYILRSINIVLSICLICLEVVTYSIKVNLKATYGTLMDQNKEGVEILNSKNAVFTTNFLIFIAKVVLFLICSPPGYNLVITGKMLGGKFTYTLDGIIMLVTLHRMFFLVNLYLFISKWGRKSFKKLLCKCGLDLSYTY